MNCFTFLQNCAIIYASNRSKQKSKEVTSLKLHKKKWIAPIVDAIVMILYYVVYFGFIIALLDGIWRIALGIIPLLLSALTVKVCVERIQEIEKGEEDDLSQY